jgi:hypothetical protein
VIDKERNEDVDVDVWVLILGGGEEKIMVGFFCETYIHK